MKKHLIALMTLILLITGATIISAEPAQPPYYLRQVIDQWDQDESLGQPMLTYIRNGKKTTVPVKVEVTRRCAREDSLELYATDLRNIPGGMYHTWRERFEYKVKGDLPPRWAGQYNGWMTLIETEEPRKPREPRIPMVDVDVVYEADPPLSYKPKIKKEIEPDKWERKNLYEKRRQD